MKSISIKEVEHIAFSLAQEMLRFNEPIPDFSTRFPNILESCLKTPFMKYYKGLISKAAILFYLMIKNHPFQNGNKRIAITALLVFLNKNKKWIKVSVEEFYDFTVWVAESPAKSMPDVLKALESFLRRNVVEEL